MRRPRQRSAGGGGLDAQPAWEPRIGSGSSSENLPQAGSIELNGALLGELDGRTAFRRFEATGRLDARNELLLRLQTPGDARPPFSGSPPGEISIEIQSP